MDLSVVIRDMTMSASREREGALPAMTEEEFRVFYERTARPLWSYLSRISGNRQAADDLLQEAYYRFYRAGASHVSESHRRASLFQIATNLVRDLARRGSHYSEVSLDDDSTTALPAHAAQAPDRQAVVRTDVARAMQQLDDVQREMLWLAYAQGASHEEIAQVLGVRAISVRTLLLRARRKMASILTRTEPKEVRR